MFRVTVTGIDEVLTRLDGLQQLYRLNVALALEWFGGYATTDMKLLHEFTNRTGQLERSIGYTVESWHADSVKVLVFALAPYAEEVEFGTPHSRPYPFFWPYFYKWLEPGVERISMAVRESFDAMSEPGYSGSTFTPPAGIGSIIDEVSFAPGDVAP